MSQSSPTRHRPRPEPWPGQGVGPGPLPPSGRDTPCRAAIAQPARGTGHA